MKQFADHINKFTTVSATELDAILEFFTLKSIQKKEHLLKEGQICQANYFVLKGILRKYFINETGIEKTTEFAIENWWMTETFSFINNTKTEFYIQAVEKVDLLFISKENQEQLLATHPVMEKYFRCVYQKAYAAAQMRIKFMHDYSREQLYYFFKEKQPEFLQRVPQYLIASYLGFTPEYLSEIRKKNIS